MRKTRYIKLGSGKYSCVTVLGYVSVLSGPLSSSAMDEREYHNINDKAISSLIDMAFAATITSDLSLTIEFHTWYNM